MVSGGGVRLGGRVGRGGQIGESGWWGVRVDVNEELKVFVKIQKKIGGCWGVSGGGSGLT